MTTAEKLQMLDDLRRAYGTGASQIMIDGKTVTYDRARMPGQIAALEEELGLSVRPHVTLTRFERR